MCQRAFEEKPCTLKFVPDHLRTKKMCERDVEEKPCILKFVPDPLKIQKRCDAAVEKDPWLVKYVPDWFITKEHHRVCHGRQEREKRKAQKAKIKEELLPIA